MLPDKGERTFSLTYVNDLVSTIISSLTLQTKNDICNVISTPRASIDRIVGHAQEILNNATEMVNATPDFLNRNDISQWMDMPLWLDCDYYTYDNQKLQNDFKLDCTILREGIASTIDHYNSLVWPKPKFGITEQLRQELVKKISNERKETR